MPSLPPRIKLQEAYDRQLAAVKVLEERRAAMDAESRAAALAVHVAAGRKIAEEHQDTAQQLLAIIKAAAYTYATHTGRQAPLNVLFMDGLGNHGHDPLAQIELTKVRSAAGRLGGAGSMPELIHDAMPTAAHLAAARALINSTI